jgi:hypothetical protein
MTPPLTLKLELPPSPETQSPHPCLHSWGAHNAFALVGIALDPTHHALRQLFIDQGDWNPTEERLIAAILKTYHDLYLWHPLVMAGLGNSFKRHRRALEEDRILLERYGPSPRARHTDNVSPFLLGHFEEARAALCGHDFPPTLLPLLGVEA